MDPPRVDDFPQIPGRRCLDRHLFDSHLPATLHHPESAISPYFERELDSPGARLTSKARQEGLAAYRFELVPQGPHDIGYFERKVSPSM